MWYEKKSENGATNLELGLSPEFTDIPDTEVVFKSHAEYV